MRKYIRVLIIMVMMIMPLYVKGSTYTAEQGNAEEYLKRSNYVNTYSRYLVNNNESPYNTTKIPFGFSNGQIKEVAGFSSAGFISKEEYELTIDKKLYGTGKEVSYLNEGMGFWTIDKEGNQAYAVNNRGKVVLVSQEASNYGRATEYVKSETKISGIGTKSQPFTFDPIYRVTVKTISKKAKIERTIAKENERSACNKSQSDCSEDFGYVRGNCRQDDCTIEVKYSTTDGYVYMTDDCGGVNNSYRNTISISNVDRDTVCNVTFGIGRYKITLKNEDIKGDKAENEVEPDEIYLKYNTGFYTDYDFLSQIRRLTTLPVKEGRRFDGYVNRDKTIWLINKDGVINQEAKDKITTNSEFFIEWYHNKYNIRYVPGHETVVLGTSSPALGIYDDDTALKIDPPTRQGYNFAGWTVQGIDVTTARYGTSSGSVNTKFNKDGQTLAPNATYFYNLNQTDGAMVTFTATWTPRNDTIFTVNRWKQKVDVQSEEKNTTNYDLDVKTYTGTSDQDKQAPQDTFTGFTSISPVGEVFVKYDGSGYIDYYYRRNKVKLSFYMNGGTMQSNKGSAISTNGDLIRISSKDYRPWNYGQIVNLPQWNDSTYINVRKTGYTPVEGKEWCTAADGSGTCYNMGTDYTSLNAFCDASSGDCSKSLYINWKATVYNIKYLLNNGTHTSTPKTGTYDKVVTIENPTKKITVTGNKNGTGATIGEPSSAEQIFAGWTATGLDTSTAKYGSTTETTSSWSNGSTKVKSKYFKNLRSTTGDVNLTANWTAVNITVPTVTKTGYECEWNTKQDKTGDRIASGGAYVPKSTDPTAITIYAFCTPNPYKIEYNKNNGTLGNPSPTTATYDEAVNIAYPTRAGYVFSGWTGETNLNTSTALYGTSSTSITTSWSNASTVVKRNYFKNLTPTKNQTVKLKAEWGPIVYTVDYNLVYGSHGTNHPTSIKYDETKQINNPTKKITVSGNANGSGATIATATYADQTFAGWTADSGLNTSTAKTGSSSSSVTTTWSNGSTKVQTEWFKNLRNQEGKVTLTANWTAVRIKTPKVSRTGYDCWYNTSSNGSGTRYESEGYYTPDASGSTSVTLYAFCSPKVFTVSLNNQSASTGGTSTIYLKYNTGYYLDAAASSKKMTTSANPITVPTKTGFAFAGYYTAASGGDQIITSTGYLKSGASLTIKDANTSLYAHWNDTEAPKCTLKATTSGVVFASTSDNVGVTNSGINKSTTAAYGTTTVALSAGTFYGHVKDAAGNTGRCSITIEATKVTKYDKVTSTCNESIKNYTQTIQKCNRSVASYNKTTQTCGRTFAYYTMTTQTCGRKVNSYDKTTQTCSKKVDHYTCKASAIKGSCPSGYTDTGSNCVKYQWKHVLWGQEGNGRNCYYGGTDAAGYSYSWCQYVSASQSYPYSCPGGAGTRYGTTCYNYNQSACYGAWSISTTYYNYYFSSSKTTTTSCSTGSSFTCNVNKVGSSYVSDCNPGYSYSFSSSTSYPGSCSKGSSFTCNAGNYNKSYVSNCAANYNYSFSSSTSNGVSSCSTGSSFTCNAGNYNKQYVSNCAANYNYAFGSSTATANNCTVGSSFTCNATNYNSQYISKCDTNYQYNFGTSTASVTSCSTGSSFTCNAANKTKSYVSACNPTATACQTSGYTKVTDSYCYKY